MDQIKIGLFIKECRKAKNMTQEQLANILYVQPKTISKWETGHGTPDVSIMYNLCEALDITLNELFLGKHIEDKSLINNENEKLLLEIYMKEKVLNKRIMIGEVILGIAFIIASITLLFVASLLEIDVLYRFLLIVGAAVLIIVGLIGLTLLDCNVGYFECKECGERFIPTFSQYLFGIHTTTKRYLKCPKCGKKSWCSKRMASKEDK